VTVAVIGAGFAGLAAADRLNAQGVTVDVFEARSHWGGHTHSLETEGFVFDEGPHVSFTKDPDVRSAFLEGAGEVNEFEARITNHYNGHWLEHPAQCHLHGLDADLITRCIVDFVDSRREERPVTTYEDWCRASFGDTFAEHFPMAYTRKYWTVEAAAMSTEWIGRRVYPPKLEEVVRGAVDPSSDGGFHYLSSFRYPVEGGYQSFMRAMARPELIRLDREVVGLDITERVLRFADGSSQAYERLISTMPLPDLVARISSPRVPTEVAEAATRLLCTSVVLVDLAVDRADLFSHHWFYAYDAEISFSRVHFPHMLSARNAPDGRGSVQAEIYHSPHRPLPCEVAALPERVGRELVGLGVLGSTREIIWSRAREVPRANVVFDHDRRPALGVITPWLGDHGIVLAGRYGEWGYHWTDDATRSGWAAADAILHGSGVKPRSS
jgi:protoporphyrinogen oxidase